MRLTPQYSYLPYNLGTGLSAHESQERRRDRVYEGEMLAPNSAEPYNALGTLKASEGKRAEAERLYREALQKNPSLLPARHNLALLLADQKSRQKEAIDLWRENLRQSPDYLPSRLSLAGALAAQSDNPAAAKNTAKFSTPSPITWRHASR